MSLTKGRPTSAGQSLPKDIDNIYYTAFSESILLGCFYDARKCSVLSQLPLNKKLIIKSTQYRSVTCTIMTDNTFDIEDFFRTIGITDELWLNLTLNSIPTENMGLLCYYSFSKNTNTRYLYYYYVSEENSISSEKNVVKIGLPTDIPHFSTTHVISTVRVGIQAFIVLQLSSNDQINLDRLLEKIKDQLIMNKFELSKVDKSLLNEITVTKIFSNTQSLNQFSKLEDICQTIIQMKVHSYKHSPLQYALRPINWFYPTYPTEKAKYIALEQETIKIIKKYLLHLLSKLSDIKICFNSKLKHTLQKYLEVQYDTLRQQFINVDTIYSNEIKRLRDLVIKMRHGKIQQKMINDLLVDKSNDSLENNLDHTKKYIQSLTEKVQLIDELNEQNISYLNMAQLPTQANHDLNTIFQDILQNNKSQLIFCSSDHLKDGNSSSWTTQYANWLKTCETDPSLTLVYADFSYSSFHLTEVRILRAISLHDVTTTTKLASTHTSTDEEAVQTSNKQSQDFRESPIPPRSPEVDPNNAIGQSTSSVLSNPEDLLIRKSESEGIEEPLNSSSSSSSSKLSDSEDTYSTTEKSNIVQEVVNKSDSSNLSTKKSRVSFNDEETKYIEEQCDVSTSPVIVPPPVAPRTRRPVSTLNEPPIDPLSMTSQIQELSDLFDELLQSADQSPNSSRSSPNIPIETIPQPENQIEDNKTQSNTSKSFIGLTLEDTPRKRRRLNASRIPDIKYINILLLGESGVGKSTFINALLNYHSFKTFQDARSNQPLVAIPVSFTTTVGNDFQERIITFGDQDDSNENHNRSGQSVTQSCRSYLFQIDSQTKLRIIDTPGMGDTRGLDQDDHNMQHILSYINNLSHINAICILLKPNESRLNVVLQLYFARLLNFLGENIRKNIMFCFTNSRSTFYTPGNSGSLLRKMFKKLMIEDIPFDKSNTFCFDSESFRYLVALENEIEFDENEENEYEQSWTNSSIECNRFIKHICEEVKCCFESEWQSIEHAQFKISEIIRPMLETTRNIYRNITLLRKNTTNRIIKLNPTILSKPLTICYQCERIPKRFSDFWILPDDLHTFSETCHDCDCPQKKHIDVDYELDYQLIDSGDSDDFKKMKYDFKQLQLAILEFAQFYASINDNMKLNDPVLSAMKRIIKEENQICSQKGSTCLNNTLRDIFVTLMETYKERQTIFRSNKIPLDLQNVYEHIKNISEIDEVREQLCIIKQKQELYMKQYEKQVS